MLVEERRSLLLELVRLKGFAALDDLRRELQVSESTIRRDLDLLEEAGAAKRTHGGVFYTGGSPKLPHFEVRQPANWEKKRAIAHRAAELIHDGDTLLLDGGTTTYELAKLLVGRHLQVVTNSLPLANLFASSPNTDLVLVGGYIYPRTGVSLGPYADRMLAGLTVQKTVLSVAGITARGCYNSNLLLVETEKAMLKAADEVIVVADSGKFGRQSLAHLCPLAEIDRLVVDQGLSEEWRDLATAEGVEVLLADPVENGVQRESARGGAEQPTQDEPPAN